MYSTRGCAGGDRQTAAGTFARVVRRATARQNAGMAHITDGDTGHEAAFEARLRDWLRTDAGVSEWRRLARLDEETALVSKFEEGFAPRLHQLLDALPELLDEPVVLAAYSAEVERAAPATPRVDAWDSAMRGLLRDACARLGITEEDNQQAFVRVGVDSVRAILDSVLWTVPSVGEAYAPVDGERAAYLDVVRAFAGRDFFTRNYGLFEEHLVQNHCPGSAYARVMLAQAWRACTGTEPPSSADA
jgi:cob(I)alamin adenosyltransferase